MRRLAPAFAMYLAACQTALPQKPQAYLVDVGFEGGECTIAVEGVRVPAADVEQRMMQLPNKSADIRVRAAPDIPYRCIGGAIYSAQRANFIRIGFVQEETRP